MTQDGLDLLRRAAQDSGRVHVEIGDSDEHSATIAELVAEGLLHPHSDNGVDPSRLTYQLTDSGCETVRWREE